MSKKLWSVMIVAFALLGLVASVDAQTKEEAATSAALSWLSKVDANNYPLAYDTANINYRTIVPFDEFEDGLNKFRKPFGNVVSRTLLSRTYQTTMSGAPDGEYVVIEFSASFVKKASCVESVIMKFDPSAGSWGQYGYVFKS